MAALFYAPERVAATVSNDGSAQKSTAIQVKDWIAAARGRFFKRSLRRHGLRREI
jgi:hypothetical protein